MANFQIPILSEQENQRLLSEAVISEKRRTVKILHQKGDEFNHVFNFICDDSYMHPHLHPGDEKIENIHILKGSCAVIYFDDAGNPFHATLLGGGGSSIIKVPAFTWHTYVMLTDLVVTYETMLGVYQPDTWKRLATWAPSEGSETSLQYLNQLKQISTKLLQSQK